MPLRPSEWQLARQREAVIRPLAEADRLSCLQVDRAAKILALGPQCYLPDAGEGVCSSCLENSAKPSICHG